MGRNLNNRLSNLERRSPARGHLCQIVKVRADGTEEGFSSFRTFHPVTKIRVVYQKARSYDAPDSSPGPGQLTH